MYSSRVMPSEMKSQEEIILMRQLALIVKSKQWRMLSWDGGSTCSDTRLAKNNRGGCFDTSPVMPVLFGLLNSYC